MPQNAGFVDSNRASYVPFKIQGETIARSESDQSNIEVYDYSGEKISSAYIVTGATIDSSVIPVKLGTTEGYIATLNAATDTVIGYTNGDPILKLDEGTPVRMVNVRLNGYVMSGVPSAAVTYGQSIGFNATTPKTNGYPTVMPYPATGSIPREGSAMYALNAATAADVTAQKLIDYLVVL